MSASLENEIMKFKRWALTYPPDSRSGEWECDYDNWKELYTAFTNYIESNSPDVLQERDIKNIIYAIARDNEMEDLVAELAKNTNWFKKVLPHVLECDEQDAKWQFAVALGGNILPFEESEASLLNLVTDQNEYVSRMALQSLGRIGSSKTESLCIQAWETNHEYQRIMALWVLKEIHSDKLEEYLSLAEEDDRKYVVSNANEIKNA